MIMNPEVSGHLQQQTNTKTSEPTDLALKRDKEKLEKLCKSEKYKLLEHTTDIVFVQDMNFNLVYVSPSVTQLTGYSVEEVLNLGLEDFMTPESLKKATEAFQYYAALARKEKGKGNLNIPLMEYEYIRKDGSTFWGELKVTFLKDSEGNLIGTQGTLRDITKRKEAERKLMELEKQKTLTLNNVSEHIVYQDKNHRIIWANRAAAQSVGKKPEDLKGLYCYQVWHRNESCKNCPIESALKTGTTQAWEVMSHGRAWLIQGSPIMEENELRAIEITRDTTEHKEAEKRINQLNEMLRLLNKTMRHEMLNDLTVVGNSIEIYQDTGNEELLDNALNSVDKSFKLVKEMRSLEALVSAGESLKSYSVRDIVEEIVNGYQIEFNVKGDCTVLADEAFSSIIDNIIRNAVEHGDANEIDITTKENNESCEIQISDNGTGIPDNIKDKVFEEGFSGDGKGTGLGLFIAKKTIERYGGTIRVEDNFPAGTIFVLRLNCEKGNKNET